MNAKQKAHQTKRSNQSKSFKAQASISLTAKKWYNQNSVSKHAYNYRNHQLKENVIDSLLLDIVLVNTALLDSYPVSNESCDSYTENFQEELPNRGIS